MHLASIHVYPLKGARGIELESADVLRGGIRHDRRFMLLDASGAFVTQRERPRLALVETRIDVERGTLFLAGAPLPLVPRAAELPRVRATVWDDEVDAVRVEGEAERALSEHLGEPVTLVYMPETTLRPVEAPYGREGDRVGFADAYPYLIASTASLADVNARLPDGTPPVPMDRFRPSLVIDGAAEPFEEEKHPAVKIGGASFRMPKRCSRCVVVTVDQATAAVGKEPLRTLGRYRTESNKVYFAQNAVPLLEEGAGPLRIAAGDPVIWIDDIS